MKTKLLTEELLKSAKVFVSEKKVKNIIFSSGTYQVEVDTDKGIQWTFLQMNDQGEFLDLFCECGGSKSDCCVHLAASIEGIYRGHIKPLHLRYENCLWKTLFEYCAKSFGYEQTVIKKNEKGYFLKKGERELFNIIPKSDRAKDHFKITVDERQEETEETSIKFSNLDTDEMDNWRAGNPSSELAFELSFWSDLAKYFLFLEDDDNKANIALVEQGGLPISMKVEMKDFSMEVVLEKSAWEKLPFVLKDYKTNLPVYDLSNKEIEEIRYDEDSKSFVLKSKSLEDTKGAKAILLENWKFIPKKGFFPRQDDPLLHADVIGPDSIEAVLDKYGDSFAGWIKGSKVYKNETDVKFHLKFDQEKNFHISIYVFDKGDLKADKAGLFGSWAYISGKGFYKLSGQLFTGIERVIKNEKMGDFVDRHKSFLSKYDGYTIHQTNIESSVRYAFEGDTLVILGDELHDEENGVIDCGKYLYVQGQGFFIQGTGRYDKHVFPGMRIEKDEISQFITVNKEELETVHGFFISDEGLEKTGLMVTYVDECIEVEPRYYFSEEMMKHDPIVYGDYIYSKGKGFLEIPLSKRLPEKYLKKTLIEKNQVPFFLKHELPKIKPYILHLDTRLVVPSKLSLRLKYLEKVEGTWRMQFTFNSSLGEVNAVDIYTAYMHFSPFLLSEAGMLILKDERFHWLMRLPNEKVNVEKNMIELSTLDWIKLTVTEDVYLPASSEDPIQDALLKMLKNLNADTYSEMPSIKGLKSTLRPYQEVGVKWLWFLYSFGLPGGFLCDDMGLGKTHQSMALFAALMNKKKKTEREKCLVVCPTSVIYHWEELLENFLDKGKVLFYHGPFRNNKELKKKSYDIILTTYGIVRSDKEIFQKMDFEIAIYDEIQVAKNQKSQIHQTLKKMNTKMNLALTGTPIENSLSELKSLFDIILPKYLPADSEFREKFVIPIEKDRNIEANKFLAALIKPFVLRRKKQEVLEDLPEKIEEISISELLPKQRELYNQVATKSKELLEDEEDKSFHMHVFALLNKLKQICNHPALYHKDVANFDEYKSGKWELFVELLEECRRSKQKVVVFTQYLGMMDIIEKYLTSKEIKFSAIRGSTSDRREQVARFQTDPEYEVFVGSLNAAGVGIDLTAASVVIHYDRWWNPARENQATDRVHRMGQSRGVSVFKFVTKHSMEEHIHNIIERKTKLIENIVGYDSEEDMKRLGKSELKAILKQIQSDI
ncbi:MAG: hypothetical protein S4CHLAM20_07250 [Chlamydiia bacterium]|nr:hypothetical protein [Chlamydiia bacterium]